MEDLLKESDFVVLAVNLTPETTGLISHRQLSLMKPTATLVNISRGEDTRGRPGLWWCLMKDMELSWSCHCFPGPFSHVTGQVVDQDALVEALQARTIRAAALDVTYPEPLPRSQRFKLILKNE